MGLATDTDHQADKATCDGLPVNLDPQAPQMKIYSGTEHVKKKTKKNPPVNGMEYKQPTNGEIRHYKQNKNKTSVITSHPCSPKLYGSLTRSYNPG